MLVKQQNKLTNKETILSGSAHVYPKTYGHISKNGPSNCVSSMKRLYGGAHRGFGDLGRMAIYFQGAGEHW